MDLVKMDVVKVYQESLPEVKLVGKRYTDKDRDENGAFAKYWQQWFEEGWFDMLKEGAGIPGVSDDYIGAMRMTGAEGFEYWIGIFLAPTAQLPGGFEAVSIPAGDIGVCWLYGNEKNGELFSQAAGDMCMRAIKMSGMSFSEQGWFFERYICPRFTTPDKHGNVVLDICAYLL